MFDARVEISENFFTNVQKLTYYRGLKILFAQGPFYILSRPCLDLKPLIDSWELIKS